MFFEFVCAKCGKKLKIREDNVGGRVRCPHCQHAQLVEGPSTTLTDNPLDFIPQEPVDSGRGGQTAPPAPTPQAAIEWTDATQVSMWWSAGIGLGVFVLFYGIMILLRDTHFGEVFLERGLVQFVMVFLLGWSVGILALKYQKLVVQRASILFDLLPDDISRSITVRSVNQFVTHIRGLPVRHGESFLVNRVLRGLEHFRVLNSSSEVADRLATQSDIDANQVTSSYTLLKVFIWAIPILGFIGTVIGIGTAVGGFSGQLDTASEMSQLKESLMTVTGGLSTAFDTTLVALCFSIIIMFPTSFMQKSEEDLLNSVDEYCNENLLKRLTGAAAATSQSAALDAQDLKAAVNSALAEHHAEMAAWTKKLESIGETLGEKTIDRWSRLDSEFHQRQTTAYTQLGSSAESFQQQLAKLQQGLRGLNRVLGELGAKQIVIERRSWWSRFGRGNGEE